MTEWLKILAHSGIRGDFRSAAVRYEPRLDLATRFFGGNFGVGCLESLNVSQRFRWLLSVSFPWRKGLCKGCLTFHNAGLQAFSSRCPPEGFLKTKAPNGLAELVENQKPSAFAEGFKLGAGAGFEPATFRL